ncbi:MAG: aminomethyltransferase, partial [Gammaproteobacteria bacterium]|nr:aminomethyltransferase [Gammaproteobacteria bacterium]
LAQWMVYGDAEINMAGVDPRRFSDFAPGQYTKEKSHEDYEHRYKLHLPGEERPGGRKFRMTPLYDRLEAKGAVYTEINGWERAKWFSLDGREEEVGFRHNNVFDVVSEECRAVRERVGIMELSTFAKYEVSGADAAGMLNRISANRMPTRVGGIVLTHYLADNGRLNGESTVTRLDDDMYYVLSGATSEERDLSILRQGIAEDEEVTVSNITNEWGTLVLAGPDSRRVLSKATGTDLSNSAFPWLTGKEIDIRGRTVRALRVSYTGELGWELHCRNDDIAEVYEAVWSAGEEYGIANFGTYALNALRMEKAYKGWGAEMTNEISMVEAGLMRFFRRNKEDFRGMESTLNIEKGEISTCLVYFEVETGDNDVAGGEAVLDSGRPIGVTTSGGYGHTTGKSLGFAYVEPQYSAPGSRFDILLIDEIRKAKVLEEPVWDPGNLRPRA